MDTLTNGHIFVNSPSIRCRNSTWKVRRNYIHFERRIHVETMTSIRIDVTVVVDVSIVSFSSIFCLGSYSKAAFTLIYILIVNILSANKIIYKWPHLHIET